MLRTLDPTEGLAIHELVGLEPGQATQVGETPRHGVAVGARELVRTYGQGDTAVHALRGVSLNVPDGELLAVMGPSGSGKSTLMHLLAGLDKPTSGSVDDRRDGDLATSTTLDLTRVRREHIGFVFQFFNLLPMLTAEENVLLPLSIAGEQPDRAWLEELLGTLGLGDRRKPPALGALGRPAAARRDRARAGDAADDRVRRRADRQPRLEDQRARSSTCCATSVERYGQTIVMVTHEAARRRDRRPDPVPRRRADRQGADATRRRPRSLEVMSTLAVVTHGRPHADSPAASSARR